MTTPSHIQIPQRASSTVDTTGALQRFRALAPDRRVSHVEALRIAERQAAELRALFEIDTDYFPTELVRHLPRVQIERVFDMPASGMSFWGRGAWHIHVRADEPWTHRRFTVIHELKHIIDHPMHHYMYDERAFVTYGEQELVADYFAACVLVPEDRLRAAYAETRDHEQLAARFSVSVRRILHRLSEIGLTETIISIPGRTISPEDYLRNPTHELKGGTNDTQSKSEDFQSV